MTGEVVLRPAGIGGRGKRVAQARNPQSVHAPVAAYSHQIEVAAGARWSVLAGQVGIRADGTLPADAIG